MTIRLLFASLLPLPLLVHAGPAADFVSASRLPLLEALSAESVVVDADKQPLRQQQDRLLPLDTAEQPSGDVKKLFINNRMRVLIANALAAHQLVSQQVDVRLRTAQQL
nr:branched-chain amino acid ABC transporter permease [Candidatus Pantoea persica]